MVVYTHCPFDYCNTAWVNFSLTDPDPQLLSTGLGYCVAGVRMGSALLDPTTVFNGSILMPCSNHSLCCCSTDGFELNSSIGTINGLIFLSIVKISESTEDQDQ